MPELTFIRGGTAGPAVATRLAEDHNVSVLLLEAGPDNLELENTQMVGGMLQNFDTEHDWNLVAEPSQQMNGRPMKLSRGKFLGGSSSTNGTLMVRGMRQDYDDWEAMGNPGWGADIMWKYFKRSEGFEASPEFAADETAHGNKGPIRTTFHPLAGISSEVLKAFKSTGFPEDGDMFSTGIRWHGVGHSLRTVHNGTRISGADYLRRSRVTVRLNCRVAKVLIDPSNRAYGVELINETTKRVSQIHCRREVILSLGTYASPHVLLLSGVGPKEDLYEAGVPPLVDLPGVGKNLEDHLTVFVFYEVKQGYTQCHQMHPQSAFEASREQWRHSRGGILAGAHFGVFAFTRLDERLAKHDLWCRALSSASAVTPGRDPMGLTPNQPHVEFFNTERYMAPKQYNNPPPPGRSAFANIIELFSPRSRGYVKLRSADPMDPPIVQHNYLADPLDLLVYAEGCALGAEIVKQGEGTKDIVLGAWPPEDKHYGFTDLEQWKDYVKENATTCYHPGGTCKMGPDSDPGAVVDARLRVKGVKGLRVADCSIMPKLNNGHTQAVAYAIGEKCADLIKEDWQLQPKL